MLPLPDDEIVFQPPKIKTHSGYVTTTTTPKQHTHTQAFNATAYNQMLTQSTKQMSNMSTAAYFGGPAIGFRSGYRNMAMSFFGVLLMNDADDGDGDGDDTEQGRHPQFLMESLKWRDQQSNIFIPHQELFDVVHWNSFFPDVPRIVAYDEKLNTDVAVRYYDETNRVDWKNIDPFYNSSRPYPIAKSRVAAYRTFVQWAKRAAHNGVMENKVILRVYEGALRPHPAIQQIIDNFMASLGDEELMVFHARIEPDMQVHTRCPTQKVTSLSDILTSIYAKFPVPPAKNVLIMLNRDGLEKEGTDPKSKNQLAVHNLQVLNGIIENGLWGGKVKVIEAGTGLAENTAYHKNRLLVGGIINYYIALEAKVFVGTEVSSYSSNVVTERFFRGQKENYYYVPGKLEWVTPPKLSVPPAFGC